jgi:single-stranded DNA-binding protein
VGNVGHDAQLIRLNNRKESEPLSEEEPASTADTMSEPAQSSQEFEKVEIPREIVRFIMATNYSYRTSEGELKRNAEWHHVTVLNPMLREFASKFVKKGIKVLVEGRLKSVSSKT